MPIDPKVPAEANAPPSPRDAETEELYLQANRLLQQGQLLPASQALSNLGILQARQGDYALAVESLTQATKIDPNLWQTRDVLQWVEKQIHHRDAVSH